jgi:hypothetical protein
MEAQMTAQLNTLTECLLEIAVTLDALLCRSDIPSGEAYPMVEKLRGMPARLQQPKPREAESRVMGPHESIMTGKENERARILKLLDDPSVVEDVDAEIVLAFTTPGLRKPKRAEMARIAILETLKQRIGVGA